MNDRNGCDRVTIVVSLWGQGTLVGLSLLISTSQRMTSKAATEAAAQMRADGEQDVQDSAPGGYPHAADEKQRATPIVTGARGHPRTASSPAGSTAIGIPMDHSPDLEVGYSGESDARPTRSRPQNPTERSRKRRLLPSRQSRQGVVV